jgi:hypothetical protein
LLAEDKEFNEEFGNLSIGVCHFCLVLRSCSSCSSRLRTASFTNSLMLVYPWFGQILWTFSYRSRGMAVVLQRVFGVAGMSYLRLGNE